MKIASRVAAASAFAGIVALVVACVGDDPSSSATETPNGAPDSGGPTSSGKTCNGVTVATNDPKTGCAADSCDPCPAADHQEATCESGKCAVACAAGFSDCDPNKPGCETSTDTDPNACGGCANVCGKDANTTAVACETGKCKWECTAPYLHCGTSLASGCETNAGTSKDHCGACGHSCGGGDCISGKCQKMLLAGDPTQSTGMSALYGLGVANGYVYGTNWHSNAGLVYRVPVNGGTLEWIEGKDVNGGASPFAIDGNKIMWIMFTTAGTFTQGIWTADLDGKNAAQFYDSNNLDLLAADATHIYWTNLYLNGFYRKPRAGGNVEPFYGSDRFVTGITVEGGTIYYAAAYPAYPGPFTSFKVHAAAATNPGTSIELATVGGKPSTIRTDATYAYFYDSSTNKFNRVKKVGGGAPEPLNPTGAMPASIYTRFLVDDKRIYFFGPWSGNFNSDNAQKLYAIDKTGAGGVEVLADLGNENANAVAQDATAIYWTVYGRDSGAPYAATYKVAK